jgi:hypothetical protein
MDDPKDRDSVELCVCVFVCVCVTTHFTCFTSTKVQILTLEELCVSDDPHLLQVWREPTTRIYIYSYFLLIFTTDIFDRGRGGYQVTL